MVVSESKKKGDMKGRPNPAQENCDGSDLDICPDLILAALGAALAAIFAILFTLITSAGRRRKRSIVEDAPVPFTAVLQDLSWNLGISLAITSCQDMHIMFAEVCVCVCVCVLRKCTLI